MTLAICPFCGKEKIGALVSCAECGEKPRTLNEVTEALALSDHFFERQELTEFGAQIKRGEDPTLDARFVKNLRRSVARDPMLRNYIACGGDPLERRRRLALERRVAIASVVALLLLLAGMVYYFLVT